MAEAARRAATDAGAGDRAARGADSVRVVELLSWRYRDPAALVAERLGATPRARPATRTPAATAPRRS